MRFRFVFSIVIVILAGCNLGEEQGTPGPVPPASQPPNVSDTMAGRRTPSPVPDIRVLEAVTFPFANAASLLDGVCFEFLLTQNGQVWTWTTTGDLAAFYDRVDASELCPGPVERRDFDFSQGVLAGTVTVATGCDAAHRVINVVHGARTQTVNIQLDVLPGCPYELVEPLLIALPASPTGYTLQIARP
jgi:hypothetical protein